MHWDVVIVGGGPAGAMAGMRLAGSSRVLILDKESFPRDKPCGGGVSARIVTRFPSLQPLLSGIPVRQVHGVILHSPSGLRCAYRQASPLYLMIRRVEFDHLLLREAERRGCTVRCETAVQVQADSSGCRVKTRHSDYNASLVLGCDGANSVVARVTGLRRRWDDESMAIDMMEETPYTRLNYRDRDVMEIFYGLEDSPGYAYVFPKTDHLNVGVGWRMDYFKRLKRGPAYSHHRSTVDSLIRSGRLEGSSDPDRFQPFVVPVGGVLRRTYADRVLLCGDAAGFVNAFTAEGIYYAMVSGELAAEAALQALRNGKFAASSLRIYQKLWNKEIGPELSFSVKVHHLLLNDTGRIDRIVEAANRDPGLLKTLVDYVTGRMAHRAFQIFLLRHGMRQSLNRYWKPAAFRERETHL
ncbi:MAG TPA: geranylgeranyl reductase family protein [Acidobacteriota bacterium]|jgi:geranylgeranyl reductase family protein